MRLVYRDGRGALRRVLMECTQRGFVILDVSVDRDYLPDDSDRGRDERRDRGEPPDGGAPATPSCRWCWRGRARSRTSSRT